MNERFVWPAVVAFLGALGAVVSILLFAPADSAAAQQAVISILGILGSALGSLFVWAKVRNVHQDVDEVKKQVNGRMSQLIDKLPADNHD